MNYQSKNGLPSITEEKAVEIMTIDNGAFANDMSYYAWPETFGSTAGPFGGLGGAAMSTFTIEAWQDNYTGKTLLFCNGKALKIVDRLLPLDYHGSIKGKAA